jgi:Flp pilus assembly pilin Flp
LKIRHDFFYEIGSNASQIATVKCEHIGSGEKDMSEMHRKLWLDDGGQDVPEYALMLALILVIVIGTVTAIGTDANTIFTKVQNAMSTAAAAGSS